MVPVGPGIVCREKNRDPDPEIPGPPRGSHLGSGLSQRAQAQMEDFLKTEKHGQ